MEEKINAFINQNVNSVEILPTLYAFVFCVVASFILKELYTRKSFSISGKKQIASIIPILSSIIFIIIVIIKSSLALSLGLVGALSIVRFRTPIKEPEELVYLFLAISIGIGYGSGQVLVTTMLYILILAMIYIWLSNKKIGNINEYNLIVNWSSDNINVQQVLEIIKNHSDEIKLVRSDLSESENTLVILVSPKNEFLLDELNKSFRDLDKSITLSFFEATANW